MQDKFLGLEPLGQMPDTFIIFLNIPKNCPVQGVPNGNAWKYPFLYSFANGASCQNVDFARSVGKNGILECIHF